jgi:hypothetical protein
MFVIEIFEILKVLTVKITDSTRSPCFCYKNELRKELQLASIQQHTTDSPLPQLLEIVRNDYGQKKNQKKPNVA